MGLLSSTELGSVVGANCCKGVFCKAIFSPLSKPSRLVTSHPLYYLWFSFVVELVQWSIGCIRRPPCFEPALPITDNDRRQEVGSIKQTAYCYGLLGRFTIAYGVHYVSCMKLIIKASALARTYRTMATTQVLTSDTHTPKSA
jgi:hypothetical protein